MKVTLLVILLTGAFGCSQFHDKRRSPSSVSDCGLTGSVEERIKDCSAQSDSINGIFVLVSRAGLNEVFMDKNTKLIWSDSLAAKMNHPDAEKACRSDLKEMAGISGSWRLPSINEYKTANGIRESLPRMDNWFWSSSIDHENVALAYAFSGDTGEEYIFYPNKKKSFRPLCNNIKIV
jgi:hypothetical protein